VAAAPHIGRRRKLTRIPADRDIALFLHLLGVVGLTAGIAAAALSHALARRTHSAGEVAALLGVARAGVLLAAPSAFLLVGAGIWLVTLERVGWDASWLRSAIVLFAVSLVLGAVGGRRARRARVLARQLGADGQAPTPVLRRLLDDRPSRIANVASTLAMIAVLWLMVAKP
jgi:uncharacterized membrane protein